MDDRHPKRRKDKYNPYTLSLVDGKFSRHSLASYIKRGEEKDG